LTAETFTAIAEDAHRLFWLAEARDAWTTSGLVDPSGRSGTFIGHQIEASVTWNLLPKNLTVETGFAYLIKGEFARNTPNAPVDKSDSSYFYAQTTFQL
jgi:hypothetical protein